ncbi:MAG: NAD-dependent epimerase/dehydratase family protein [Anaerolineae bacterium]|nr:NAD-dependent epimerase/dehydratase family protein [Anaerolineae bacterium]
MRIFIAGIDGYLGWALAQHLAARGHTLAGLDAMLRRDWVAEMGSESAIPIALLPDRAAAFQARFGASLTLYRGNLLDYDFIRLALAEFKPDAIVHLAEMPSAPYSMIDAAHAAFTQHNNVGGSLNLLWAMKEAAPSAHLVKLGTMGEYGTPNLDIPEGFFEVEYRGRRDILPFPRQPNSLYHLTKVHDSHNTTFACRVWGLRATDVMQGVVFGTRTDTLAADDPCSATRLDFDQCFGTAINRFCCQAVIGHPLTVYGSGGMTRGFLPLRDSVQCLALACENPPAPGEYRVFNQFEQTYNIKQLAEMVKAAGEALGLAVEVQHIENPRAEVGEHYYNPDRQKLLDLGYVPTIDLTGEVRQMLADLLPHADRIRAHRASLIPDIRWDGSKRPSQPLGGGA